MQTQKLTFLGHSGDTLSAKLTLPQEKTKVGAVFAHCFTCSKDILAARRICTRLAAQGIAVLSFDFTGLGHSEGEFANTHFSSNVEDLILACEKMQTMQYPVQLLVGHSLGGAAVISAASSNRLTALKAIATIGAPYNPEHVLDNFSANLEEIKQQGQAQVMLGGRAFTIKQSFIDDVSQQHLEQSLARMKKALLVMHAPLDQQVSIDNAAAIFANAKHPKSFITLDNADHLLTNAQDAEYAASVIVAWGQRYIQEETVESIARPQPAEGVVRVTESDAEGFKQDVSANGHHLLADEPLSMGGTDTGLTPYQLLSAGLGACTSMTIRMYARFKKWPLESVEVDVTHDKVHALDCQSCEDNNDKIDQFKRSITLQGELSATQREKLLLIADKCPVHKTLEGKIQIVTHLIS